MINIDDIEIQDRLVNLTRDLMLIPSIPSRPEDRRRCFEFIRNHLESIESVEVHEFEKDGIPSLVALPKGISEPSILMCGHLDVITHPGIDSYRSHINEGRIYGPGSGDMKGALAILLEVFRHIHTNFNHASLGIAVTSDEETGGEFGIGYLVNEMGLRCGQAMIPDGGSINEVTVEEKGILHLKITCDGHTAHAARPWKGENPIEILMDRLNELRKVFDDFEQNKDHWHPTCSITMISTENQQVNRIPDNVCAVLDVRFPSPHAVSDMLQLIQKTLGPKISVEKIISAEPTLLLPDPIYIKMTEEITGKPVRMVKDDGGSDGRFIAAHGIPVIITRPEVGNLHATDEWINIKSMVQFYHIYQKYLELKLAT